MVSVLGDIKKRTGHGLEQPAPADPARGPPEVPFNLIVSVMLTGKNKIPVSELNIAHWHISCFQTPPKLMFTGRLNYAHSLRLCYIMASALIKKSHPRTDVHTCILTFPLFPGCVLTHRAFQKLQL